MELTNWPNLPIVLSFNRKNVILFKKVLGLGLGFQYFEYLDLGLLQIELYNIKKQFFCFWLWI
jgi:hypothetical protein